MTTLFWIGIVLHVFLCLFLMLLVLVQNDKMGGLAGLGGMTSQSAFSTAGAATFIQKLTRGVAVLFLFRLSPATLPLRQLKPRQLPQLKHPLPRLLKHRLPSKEIQPLMEVRPALAGWIFNFISKVLLFLIPNSGFRILNYLSRF